jgi:hypothetical protein
MLDDHASELVACTTCGRALDGLDLDEDEVADTGLSICGECARERDCFDLDLADGELDGAIHD